MRSTTIIAESELDFFREAFHEDCQIDFHLKSWNDGFILCEIQWNENGVCGDLWTHIGVEQTKKGKILEYQIGFNGRWRELETRHFDFYITVRPRFCDVEYREG